MHSDIKDNKKKMNKEIILDRKKENACFVCSQIINYEKDDVMINENNNKKCHLVCEFSSSNTLSLLESELLSFSSNNNNNNNNNSEDKEESVLPDKCDICGEKKSIKKQVNLKKNVKYSGANNKKKNKNKVENEKEVEEVGEGEKKDLWFFFVCGHNLHLNCVNEMCGVIDIIYKCPLCPFLPEESEFMKNKMSSMDVITDLDNLPIVSNDAVLIPTNLREASSRCATAVPRFTKVSKQICHETQTLRERNGESNYKTLIPLLIDSYDQILSSIGKNLKSPPCVFEYLKVNDVDAWMLLDDNNDMEQFMKSKLISEQNRKKILSKISNHSTKKYLFGYDLIITKKYKYH